MFRFCVYKRPGFTSQIHPFISCACGGLVISLQQMVYLGLWDATKFLPHNKCMLSFHVITYSQLRLTVSRRHWGQFKDHFHPQTRPWVLKNGQVSSVRSCYFFIVQGSRLYSQYNSSCVFVHWPWIQVVSKWKLCQIPALWGSRCAILFFLRHWHRDADSIPRLLLGL